MRKILLIGNGFLYIIFFLFSSYYCKKIAGVYKVVGDPMLTITLKEDFTYVDHFDMTSGNGNWLRNKDTITLNSRWKDCCIDSVLVQKSLSNKNENCLIFFRLFDDTYPQFTCPILISNNDSLKVTVFARDTLIVAKNKDYKYIQIRVPIGYNKVAVSPVYKFEFADTLIYKFDYMYSTKGYGFTLNEKYLINKKRKILSPIKKK